MKIESPLRIFIVDDDPTSVFYTSILLENLEHEVLGSWDSGSLLAEEVLRHKPDILVIDFALPIKNGLEVYKELKAFGLTVKAILCTGSDDPTIALEAHNLGMAGFLQKGFNLTQLSAALTTAMHEDSQ